MADADGARRIRLLTISGSLRRASTNSAALAALGLIAPPGVVVASYGGLAGLPAFNPDDDGEGAVLPPPVAALRAAVGACDGLVIGAPEYAHGVPGALKNGLDWLVAGDEAAGKPVMLVNAAPRAFHAQAALREILATMAARLAPESFVTLPLTGETPSPAQIVADARMRRALAEGLAAFLIAIEGSGQARPVNAFTPLA